MGSAHAVVSSFERHGFAELLLQPEIPLLVVGRGFVRLIVADRKPEVGCGTRRCALAERLHQTVRKRIGNGRDRRAPSIVLTNGVFCEKPMPTLPDVS